SIPMSPILAPPSRVRRSIAHARKVPTTMKSPPDQLSLPLFDTTALTSSMGLYSGLSFGEPADDPIAETEDDAPAPVVLPARNFRLTGARRLAPDWKTRAADNVAAIRLMLQIEEEARNATPEEQDRLALFTSFGAGDLANKPLPPIRRGTLPDGLGHPRGGPRAARLAGRAREPRARHAICALHPGIHGAGDMARVASHGLFRRSRP